jgi:hypothetical protein
VLGGTQSLHTNSLDEALALPTEEAVTIAAAHAAGHRARVRRREHADPLAGSYFVEKLTNDIEAEALEYFRKIDAMGGMVAAVERGFPQREIQEAAFQFQKAVDRKDKIIVGVNDYIMEEDPFPILYIDESVAESQTASVQRLKETRDDARVQKCLEDLRQAARGTDNVMYPMLECARAYATLGEMCDAPARRVGRIPGTPDVLAIGRVIGPAVVLLAVGAAHAVSAARTASVTVVAPVATCVEAKLGSLAARPGPDGAFEFEVEDHGDADLPAGNAAASSRSISPPPTA